MSAWEDDECNAYVVNFFCMIVKRKKNCVKHSSYNFFDYSIVVMLALIAPYFHLFYPKKKVRCLFYLNAFYESTCC